MASLMDRMLKNTIVEGSGVMSTSDFFTKANFVQTEVPIINIAFSGQVDGGMLPGLSIIAGASKSFKSAITCYCLKAYFDKYDDAIALFYDTEAGISLDMMESFGIDTSRVLHIPVEHVEQLKFDMVKKLDDLKRGDHVFIMVDSIGMIPSKKETDDAIDERAVADMTRAKAIRSLLRLVTIQFTKKELPCFMINHVMDEIGAMYPKKVIPGGTAVLYSCNQAWIITKSQEKDSEGLKGWNFTINIEKSRMVKEKSKLTFQVLYNGGIQKHSGILDLAIESGDIIKAPAGWYQLVDKETGEVSGKVRASAIAPFCDEVLKRQSFKDFVTKKYKLVANLEEDEYDLEDDPE